jgi:PadR family transcriptional regulator PadR
MNTLGEFEALVLMAVLRLGAASHPPALRAEIEQRTQRTVARGAIYVTLDRLEAKRLLSSATDADPGGRKRRVYRVSVKGLRALRRSLAAVDRMRTGLKPVLGEP